MESIGKYFSILKRYSLTIIVSLVFGVFAYLYTLDSLTAMIEQSMMEMAKQGAVSIENDINLRLSALKTVSKLDYLVSDSNTIDDKLKFLRSLNEDFSDSEFALVEPNGTLLSISGKVYDASDDAFFLTAKDGNSTVGIIKRDVFMDSAALAFASPIYDGETFIGALCSIYPVEIYCSMVERVNCFCNGYGYIIDSQGNIVAHKDRSLIHTNFINEAKIDSGLARLAAIEINRISGKKSSGRYNYKGQEKIIGYAPIKGVQWSFGVTSTKSDALKSAGPILIFTGLFSCIIGLLLIVVNIYFVINTRRINRNKQSFKNAIETANILIISFLEDGFIIDYNPIAERLLGYTRDEVVKTLRIYDFLDAKNRQKLDRILKECEKEACKGSVELRIRTSNGEFRHILVNLSVLSHGNTDPLFELMGVDITGRVNSEQELIDKHEELTAVYEELAASEEELKDQLSELILQKKMLQEKDERYNLVVEASNIGIWDWDASTNKYTYSDKWYEIFGLDKDEYLGRESDWHNLILKEDVKHAHNTYKEHLEKKTESYECEYRIMTPNGKIKWINAVGKALWDKSGKIIKLAGAHTDITERKKIEEDVNRLAYYDTLTGLPNRSHLYKNFCKIIENANEHLALIYIDLNNFKMINDSYGHTIGDKLIIEVSRRIGNICSENMHLCRIGGDEFVIMHWDYESENALTEFIENLLYKLEDRIIIGEYNINVSVTIGISIYPSDANNFDDLIKNADTAMFKATEKKCKYMFYNKGMNEALLWSLNLRNGIQTALEDKEFTLHYQPQIRTSDMKIVGFEALVRWQSKTMGMIEPDKFIPITEETGLIIPLGEWILKEALKFISKLHKKGYKEMAMSINISVYQLIQNNFAEMVLKHIEESGIPSEFIELEITESAMMQSVDSVLQNIELLRAKGVKIALDDFGTGYSSLNYLTKIPINTIKIDKSFVDDIGHTKERSLLLGLIIDIGRRLGFNIVAEGVEAIEQLNYLIKRHCTRVQGYLFSKPISEQEVIELLNSDYKWKIH